MNWRGERSRGWGGWAEAEARSRKRSGSSAQITRRCGRRRASSARAPRAATTSLASFSTRSASLLPPTAWMKCCPASATTAGGSQSCRSRPRFGRRDSRRSRHRSQRLANSKTRPALRRVARGARRWQPASFRVFSAFATTVSRGSLPSSLTRRGPLVAKSRSTCSPPALRPLVGQDYQRLNAPLRLGETHDLSACARTGRPAARDPGAYPRRCATS